MDSNLEKKLAKGVRFILAPFVVEVISMIYIKKFSLFILIGLITFLTGCSANKSEIPQKEKNFIPISNVDEVYELNFPVSTDTFERQLEKFEYNIRKYEGLEEDTDLVPYMNIMYWDNEKNDRLVIPLDEATKEQKEQVQYIGYNDGICSELLVFSNFMLEMGDYATTDAYGYRSTNLGTSVATYDLDKDDISNISYHLSDGDLLLTEAVDYVEKHMKEDYYYVGSEYLDYSVFGIDVRKLTDEIYYYEFDVGTAYDGVTSLDSMNEDSGKDNLTAEPFGTNHLVTMFEKDKLGFIWSCCQNFESVQTLNTYDKVLPLDVVCETLSNYISKDKQFQISSIELLYQTEFEYENEEKREWGYIQLRTQVYLNTERCILMWMRLQVILLPWYIRIRQVTVILVRKINEKGNSFREIPDLYCWDYVIVFYKSFSGK